MALLNVRDAKFIVEEKIITVSGPYCINEYLKQIYKRNKCHTPIIKCVSIQSYKFNLTHTQKFSINGCLNLHKPIKQTLKYF